MQDLWSLVIYKVLKAPIEGGSMYTTPPVYEGQAKQVHCTLLRPGMEQTVDCTRRLASADCPCSEDKELSDGDLLVRSRKLLR